MMKNFLKNTGLLILALLFVFHSTSVHAQDSGETLYTQSLIDQANEAMQQIKDESTLTLESLKDRIQNLPRNDARRQQALDAVNNIEKEVQDLQKIDGGPKITPSVGSSLPLVELNEDFVLQQQKVEEGFVSVNRILIAPAKPENVPEGDVVQDFIPQLVRQLFRFAWVAVFVSLVVSGVMFVMAFGNDERIESAKKIMYFSILGFIFVALAFAIVTAINGIDFFRLN